MFTYKLPSFTHLFVAVLDNIVWNTFCDFVHSSFKGRVCFVQCCKSSFRKFDRNPRESAATHKGHYIYSFDARCKCRGFERNFNESKSACFSNADVRKTVFVWLLQACNMLFSKFFMGRGWSAAFLFTCLVYNVTIQYLDFKLNRGRFTVVLKRPSTIPPELLWLTAMYILKSLE